MKVYVVTETWNDHGEYEDYHNNWNGFIAVYSTLDKAVEGIKELILSDENFDSSKLDPTFDKIDFTPATENVSDNGEVIYVLPTLYYDGEWDLEQYDVRYRIHETEIY